MVALLLGLCWLDVHGPRPGMYFFPLAAVVCVLATEELLAMFRAVGHEPHRLATHVATLVTLIGASLPLSWSDGTGNTTVGRLGCLGLAIAAGFIVNVIAEMWRYTAPGKTITQLALATLAVVYVGGLLGFLVQLRLLPIDGERFHGGMVALFSMIAVVKFTDIGAYFGGKKWGKHKLAPVISPGKTWEGAASGLALGTAMAFLMLGPFARLMGLPSERAWLPWIGGAIVYGVCVSIAGMIGDLTESLLKRDAGMKDSSTWLPGFGGVLDLLDSLLLAAPVAYLLWILRVVSV